MSQPTENPNADAEKSAWLREELADRLDDEGAPDLSKPLRRCGTELTLVCTSCFCRKTGKEQCKKRWCPVCQRIISAQRLQRFGHAARTMQRPLSIMLSHQNEHDGAAVFSTLRPAFKRFRRQDLWRKNVLGGVMSYEVTNRFGTWHDHVHALVDCRWLALVTREPRKSDTRAVQRALLKSAKHELTEAWASCLDQETAITWVDRADQGRLIEHIKYTVKGSDLLKCSTPIAPMLRALKGRRLVQPFGTLYGLGKAWKDEDETRKQECKCEHCGEKRSFLPEAVIGGHIDRMREGKKHSLKGRRF